MRRQRCGACWVEFAGLSLLEWSTPAPGHPRGGCRHRRSADLQLGSGEHRKRLDFKCIINPYQLYVSTRDWGETGRLNANRLERLAKTLNVHIELATLLKHVKATELFLGLGRLAPATLPRGETRQVHTP